MKFPATTPPSNVNVYAMVGVLTSVDDVHTTKGELGNTTALIVGLPQYSPIDCISLRLGKRQSAWPAKVDVSASFSASAQIGEAAPPLLQLAPLKPSAQTFHMRPVRLCVTVPSMLLVKALVGVF